MATPGRKQAVGLRSTLRRSLRHLQHRRTQLGLETPDEIKYLGEFDDLLESLEFAEEEIEDAITAVDALIEQIDRRKINGS